MITFVSIGLSAGMLFAQTGRKANTHSQEPISIMGNNGAPLKRTCGTLPPSEEWEMQFQKLIEQYVKDHPEAINGKVYANYTIPIVFHVIHGGQAVGTYPNISQQQINSQITVLNADYAGTGLNSSTYPSNAFVNYATANNLPSANLDGSGRVKIANTGIQFCLATKDPNGNTLAEPGIDRINYVSKGWSNPASFTSASSFQSFIESTVKPNSIWDPNRYFNVWLTDCNSSVGLLGYATFPAGSTLTGLSPTGTSSNDGVWIWTKACGSSSIWPSGSYAPPYDKGRTLTHETGHYLGLRHIWGDGTCATDYCNDTPPAQTANYGTISSYPYHVGTCSGNSPDGEMYMNFMDYTDDASMYMFTTDQNTRIQTAMANGTYRKNLSASAATLCVSSPAANACFQTPASACINSAVSMTNCSTGTPTPTYTWSTSPNSGVTISPNPNASNPTITFANPGTYSIILTANNGTASTSSQIINISSCTTSTVCIDTLSNASNVDTITVYRAGADNTTPGCSPNAGYVVGTNCYGDLEKAEWYAASTYSQVPNASITGAIVIFFKSGTRGTGGNSSTSVNCKLYNGTLSGGPTSQIGTTANANLGQITSATPTTGVQYFGNPGLAYTNPILIPYKYNFAPVLAPNTNGFFVSVTLPQGGGDTAVIMHTQKKTSGGTMWEKWSDNSWHNLATAWGGSLNLNGAILPILSCNVGVAETSVFASNITVMPNPSNGLFNIITTFNEKQNIQFEVMNTLGQTLDKGEFHNVMNNYLTLNLSNYETGIYFLKITNGTEKVVKRLIVNK